MSNAREAVIEAASDTALISKVSAEISTVFKLESLVSILKPDHTIGLTGFLNVDTVIVTVVPVETGPFL